MLHPIEALGLAKWKTAIQGLSFAVEAGEIVAITGPNGPGKSTLLRILYGLVKPDGGSVRVLGQDPYRTPGLRKKVAMAFQGPSLEPDTPLRRVVRLHARLFGLPWERVEDWANRLKLPLDKPLMHLSGGQAKLAEPVKALSQEAEVYLLDESSGELDSKAQAELARWMGGARPSWCPPTTGGSFPWRTEGLP